MIQLTKMEFIRFQKIQEKANTVRSHGRTFGGGGGYEERKYFTCPCCLKECRSSDWKQMNHIKMCGIKHQERTGVFKK